MAKIFEKLMESPEVEGFTVDAGDIGRFSTSRDRFHELAAGNEFLEEEEEKELLYDVKLTIMKVVFQPNRKWEFIYEGNTISAIIKDKDFWADVESGLKFSKGDKLYVVLEITKVFDNESDCFVNIDYNVIKVQKHEPRPLPPKQGKLF